MLYKNLHWLNKNFHIFSNIWSNLFSVESIRSNLLPSKRKGKLQISLKMTLKNLNSKSINICVTSIEFSFTSEKIIKFENVTFCKLIHWSSKILATANDINNYIWIICILKYLKSFYDKLNFGINSARFGLQIVLIFSNI